MADSFVRSFALFDASGRLLAWDRGFAEEFGPVAAQIVVGAPFRTLLADARAADGIARTDTTAASGDHDWADRPLVEGANDDVFEYSFGAGDAIVHVRRHALTSGGWLRVAREISAETPAAAMAASAEERWSADGDPTVEAVVRWRIGPDGATRFFPAGEDLRTVWGLPDGMDLTDTAAVLSRMATTQAENEAFGALLARAAETLEPCVYETRVRDRDDRLRWIYASVLAAREPDGGVLFAAHMRDVTREKLAHDQLEMLQSAITQANDSIQILHTTLGNVTTVAYANPAFEKLLGWPVAELIGRPSPASGSPEQLSWHAMLEMAMRGDENMVETRATRRDGTPIWIEASAKVVERRADGSIRWILVSRDISERRKTQEDLSRARDAAEAAVLAKSEFLANMSHEIRTPLTSVIGFAELLRKLDHLPDDARTYVQRISAAGQSLLTVINDVLDFSKLEAGQVELDPHAFEPAECIEGVVGLLASQTAAKGLALEVSVAADLPRWVTADGARIRQVLTNLVGNAVKFTETGQVLVSAAYHDGSPAVLRVAVADSGPGIAHDKQHRLFQRFSQVDGSVGRSHGGSGLGLAICKTLIELMGGVFGVDSEPGKGSTFWFAVPVTAAAPAAVETSEPDGKDLDGRPAHILLVDDVAVNRELVRAMLTPFGHSFEEADNGADAVKAAMGSPFDLILMDLQMPGMDGFAAARAIRATAEVNRTTPILALSANVLAEHMAAARAAGMDDHIAKPIQPVELLTKVAMWTSAEPDEDARLRTAS